NASATAIGATQIVLALKNRDKLTDKVKKLYPDFKFVHLPNRYPAGAEKLILEKLTGTIPPAGVRPQQLGYLVQNVTSLRAIGRALLDGVPVVERPLTLAMPSTGFYRNIISPIGLSVRDLINNYDLPYDPQQHLIVSSGLMMGYEISPDDLIKKTTLSLLLINRNNEKKSARPCIRCGACHTSCPLGLHPFSLTECIQKEKTDSTSFKAQIEECFLCGVCSAVCPSDIPLVQQLQKGKVCL
ncbi:MAG TPA: 4Fe-4S dicluster domain-containing protein, partial [Pontiella sp.]